MEWYWWIPIIILLLTLNILIKPIIKKAVISSKKKKLKLSSAELLGLKDEELIYTVLDRIEIRHLKAESEFEKIKEMNEKEKTVYCSKQFDSKILNGGLCGYLTENTESAAFVLSSLSKLGAVQTIDILEHFFNENKIDINDLFYFKCENTEDNDKHLTKYNFNHVDSLIVKSYCMNENISDMIIKYIRTNISDL